LFRTHAGGLSWLKLQKNTLFLISLFLISPSFLFAQDIIIKNDKSELKAKVVEITDDYIKYHDWDNLTGPIYNISKAQVFMINYQNGKREFITSNTDNKTETKVNTIKPANTSTTTTKVTTTTESPISSSPYTFTPRDKKQPKSFDNVPDRLSYFGVTLNVVGKATIPTVTWLNEVFVAPNLSLVSGFNAYYNSTESMGYKSSIFTFGIILGGAYYLNDVLKIDKNKGAVYVGANAIYQSSALKDDFFGSSTGSNFTGFGRAGGLLNFSKKFGAFAEVQIGEGDPGFVAGLAYRVVK
jgi:hypothetical protein